MEGALGSASGNCSRVSGSWRKAVLFGGMVERRRKAWCGFTEGAVESEVEGLLGVERRGKRECVNERLAYCVRIGPCA